MSALPSPDSLLSLPFECLPRSDALQYFPNSLALAMSNSLLFCDTGSQRSYICSFIVFLCLYLCVCIHVSVCVYMSVCVSLFVCVFLQFEDVAGRDDLMGLEDTLRKIILCLVLSVVTVVVMVVW